MSYYAQQQVPPPAPRSQAYPPPPEGQTAYPAGYVAAPPPVGYPTRDGSVNTQQVPVETRSRGRGGFWEGCCAALCCCCVLDMCF